MTFDQLRRIADTVLFEGYLLYPYRASSPKNRFRFPFGVLAPRSWSEAGGCEPWWMECQCLAATSGPITARLRFLQLERRRVEALGPAGFEPVARLELKDSLHVSFDGGVVHELEERFDGEPQERTFELGGEREVEELRDGDRIVGRIVRERRPIRGSIQASAQLIVAEKVVQRWTLRVENHTDWTALEAPRDDVLACSLAAAHLMLAVDGAFVSLLDPPPWAKEAAAACRNVRTFPVLAGDRAMLSAPIILYDHPQLAPESQGDFFDATEIDELLTLRTATLTEREMQEARATDPRAEALIDRVMATPAEAHARLHGAIRELRDGEMIPIPPAIAQGSRVRLRPGKRRTDAQDLLYAGCCATVEEVKLDLEGRTVFAVTIDDDPAAELHRWYGRFHYYYSDELEPAE